MNKNLSFAIEKAVEKINPQDEFIINQNKSEKKTGFIFTNITNRTFSK